MPIATPPVKVTRSTSALVISSSAISRGSPVITESISRRQAGLVQDVGEEVAPTSGVFSVGFSTMRLLVAIAGATLCATWFSGWLNGVIARDRAEQRLAQRVDACGSCRAA